MADEILKLFPNEKRETYYIPSKLKRNSLDGRSERARGRLVDKFHNNLQLYRRMCGYKKDSEKSDGNSTNNATAEISNKRKNFVGHRTPITFREIVNIFIFSNR